MSKQSSVLFLCCCFCVCALSSVSSLKILGLFPHPGKSHFTAFEHLLQVLARQGHELTVISPFPQKTPIPGYKDVSLEKSTDIILAKFDIDSMDTSWMRFYWAPLMIAGLSTGICEQLKTKPMQEFLKNNDKFDLILTEIFNNDCFMGFVHKYQVPFIGLSSTYLQSYSYGIIGSPVNPAFVPSPFLPHSDRMNFWERLENTINYFYAATVHKFLIDIPNNKAAKEYFGEDLPPLHDIQKNISLILVNNHFTLNFPRANVPGMIEVGGMFLDKPKQLPQNLDKFISESKDGVIYFSMGSMLKGSTFSPEKRNIFFKVFSQLKQRVLWKFENTTLTNLPKNVMVQNWIPQYDVLCHPNVIGFISHAGLLGTTEAVQCGVPLVVMPQYGDQFTNAKSVEVRGVGVYLYLEDVTEETLTEALSKILSQKYQQRAKEFSNEFLDRPQSPIDTAIYWIEYVVRHKGAPQLRSAIVDMPLYQYLLLDVMAFLTVTLVTIMFVSYCVVRLIFKLFRKPSPAKIKKK